jgi:hypothetical protein
MLDAQVFVAPLLKLAVRMNLVRMMIFSVKVRIGIFGTTSKAAILSQLKPIISSRRLGESNCGPGV